MNLKGAWDNHTRHSTSLSNSVRQLAIAGIAVSWGWGAGDQKGILQWAATFFVGALFFDVCQYAVATVCWQRFTRKKELELRRRHRVGRKVNHDAVLGETFDAWDWINTPATVAFWLKAGGVLVGYGLLLAYFVGKQAP